MKSENTQADVSLDEILATFDPAERPKKSLTGGSPIAIFVTQDDKARYKRLQQLSDQRFGKKLRELVLAAMDKAESKAS